MKLSDPGGGCNGGPCPTVYSTDKGTLVVQGYVVKGIKGVVVPRSLLGRRANSSALRRVAGTAVVVRGRAVDPATVEGLGQMDSNEALVEIRKPHNYEPAPKGKYDSDWLADWLKGITAAVAELN